MSRSSRRATRGQRELRFALISTVAMMIVEWLAAWSSGSLSLLADAGHMLADASALALSLFAAWFSTRPATSEKTYGYYRTEILAALANGIALWLLVVWIYVRALWRLLEPMPVQAGVMLVIASLGLVVNLLNGWILSRAGARSLNVRGAWLNVMSDALGSLGVIIAGGLIHWRGWMVADPIASMVIGVLIGANSWQLVKQSVNILLEGSPSHLRSPDVMEAMRALPGVCDVHDVHLWTITTGLDAMSGHVIAEDIGTGSQLLQQLNELLSRRFGIRHTTLQIEPRDHACGLVGASHRPT